MSRTDERSGLKLATHANGKLTVYQGRCSSRVCVLHVQGALQAPLNGELELQVRAVLDRGERVIVLDLTRTATVDAAGVGELVRAYNMALAASGTLRVVHPTTRVHQILERVGLFDILRRG
jgi:anti-anti-sigma factor